MVWLAWYENRKHLQDKGDDEEDDNDEGDMKIEPSLGTLLAQLPRELVELIIQFM